MIFNAETSFVKTHIFRVRRPAADYTRRVLPGTFPVLAGEVTRQLLPSDQPADREAATDE